MSSDKSVVIRCVKAACRKKLRVPTNKGELRLTCPRCHETWDWQPEGNVVVEPIPYSLERKFFLLGDYKVVYDCPKCEHNLCNPLDDAGSDDTCPECGCDFVVPGIDDLKRIRQEIENKRQSKIHKAIQERIEVEAEKQSEKQAASDKAELERIAQHNRRINKVIEITGHLFSKKILNEYPHVTEEDIISLQLAMYDKINFLVKSEKGQQPQQHKLSL